MARVSIRPFAYGSSDVALIQELDTAVFGDKDYEPYSLRQLLDLFSEVTFIAEEEGRPLGYIMGGRSSDAPPRGWVLSFAVLEDNHLAGHLLFERLIEEFRSRSLADDLWLTANPDNKLLEDLVHQFGFRAIEKVDDYFEEGSRRTLMRLLL